MNVTISALIWALTTFVSKPDTTRCIVVSQLFPELSSDMKLLGYDTLTITICYNGNQEIIKSPYYVFKGHSFDLETAKPFYTYMVFNKGDQYAISYKDKYSSKVLLDSAIKKLWISSFNFEYLFDSGWVKPSLASSKDNGIMETYTMKSVDLSGSITLWYTKDIEADYSLAHKLEKPGYKLTRVKIINDAHYIPRYKLKMDQVIQEWSIIEIPVPDDIKKYFK